MLDRSQVTTPGPSDFVRERVPEKPFPLIQSNITAKKDIEDLRALEHVMKSTAGWVDEEAGVARIPVETAIGLMLEEGFATQAPRSDPFELRPGEEVMNVGSEVESSNEDDVAQPEGPADTETEE